MAGPTTYFDPAAVDRLDARAAGLVQRRAAALGSAYRLFYREPLELVRGEGARVWDRDGVEYLDVYNNVPSVGHAHPRVVTAIAEQAARLNTHTRYLDEATISYAEDLLGTFSAHLANVMFTCTGSEANDLALRIAKAATGNEGVIVTRNAYHGVTTEIAAISPSLGGLDSLAPWVRVFDAPAPGIDLGAAVVGAIAELAAAGIRPAALVVDTIFASDGVFPDAAGLPGAVAAIHAAGGIFLADEVQPGFGRLGGRRAGSDADAGLWGFARHGLEPDLVSLGKPMGNGHPIAGVVARRELVDAFAAHGRYFNTFGGNPVSIAAAQATLDVVRDERLPEHAARVGATLLAQLRQLDDPRIGAVRGAGLFLGVDLVDAAGRPDETLALNVVNALRERRILLAASGPDNHTLKIRPPLVFDDADATRLVTELAAALKECP